MHGKNFLSANNRQHEVIAPFYGAALASVASYPSLNARCYCATNVRLFYCVCLFSLPLCDKVESWCPLLPGRVIPKASTQSTEVPKNIPVYVDYVAAVFLSPLFCVYLFAVIRCR